MALGFLFSVSSCDLFDLDINTNPNTPSTVTPELLLTNVMVDGFAGITGLASTASGFVVHNTNSDNFQFNNQSFNGTWNFYYTGPLKDLDELVKLTSVDANGDGKSDNPRYLAMAQVLKAYFFSIMVDMWGDVPFSQAFQGNSDEVIKTPVYDDDAAVYAACIQLLDDALANLNLPNPASVVKGDIMYSTNSATNKTKWTKAATSLKLKLLLQTRLVDASAADKIKDIINNQQANLITSSADDFLFQFSTSISPDYRHANYAYAGADYGGGYISHQLMFEMLKNADPRTPYYFKRQTKTFLDKNDATQKQTIPCSQRSDCKYDYFPTSKFVLPELYGAGTTDISAVVDVTAPTFGALSSTFPPANVNVDTDVITYGTPQNILTGQLVRISTTGELPAGLFTPVTAPATPPTAVDFYAIKVDANSFKLASSAANATAGTAVDITSAGTGTHRIREKGVISKWYVKAGELATTGKPLLDILLKNVTTTVLATQTGLATQAKAEGASLIQGETVSSINALEYMSGFFGRDRSDPSGVPNDTGIRTAHGLYPEGGLYDDVPEPANNNKGRGDGIFPIATSWMVKFWQIEAALTVAGVNPPQSVDALFAAAIREQMAKVSSFASKDSGAPIGGIASADVTAYVNAQAAKLTAAGTSAAKLAVALKQAWFCNYGNGLEMYNTFRRTGLPADLQQPLQLPGNFALRIPYAQDELNLNPNTPVKTYDTPDAAIFWDQLKFQFVK